MGSAAGPALTTVVQNTILVWFDYTRLIALCFLRLAFKLKPRLADRAKMGAALTDRDAPDGCAAARAGFSAALVDLEVVLEVSAPVNPVDAGALAADALLQH